MPEQCLLPRGSSDSGEFSDLGNLKTPLDAEHLISVRSMLSLFLLSQNTDSGGKRIEEDGSGVDETDGMYASKLVA